MRASVAKDLVVDDEPKSGRSWASICGATVRVVSAADGEEALRAYKRERRTWSC